MGRSHVLHAFSVHISPGVLKSIANATVTKTLLSSIGEDGFTGKHFFRGIVSGQPVPSDLPEMEGDVVIEKGCYVRGKTVQEVAPSLGAGDIILKGANAVDLKTGEAAVLIGHPEGGTLASIWQACVGRRTKVIVPVGVEKRVDGPVKELCELCCSPDANGARLAAAPGKAFTEIDAIRQLTGVDAKLIAAGGVCGCEGAAWFQCSGTDEQLQKLYACIAKVKQTPAFAF